MGVWILTTGEYNEGETIKGVYATKSDARNDFFKAVSGLSFRPNSADDASWEESVRTPVEISARSDFVQLKWYEVQS